MDKVQGQRIERIVVDMIDELESPPGGASEEVNSDDMERLNEAAAVFDESQGQGMITSVRKLLSVIPLNISIKCMFDSQSIVRDCLIIIIIFVVVFKRMIQTMCQRRPKG